MQSRRETNTKIIRPIYLYSVGKLESNKKAESKTWNLNKLRVRLST